MKWKLRGEIVDLSSKGMIMGILNLTPDSFSDGGCFSHTGKAVEHALKLINDGADIVDIGGESTRPGALSIPIKQELERTIPVIKALRQQTTAYISIDTSKAEVAQAALEAGADIVNDVTGLTADQAMSSVCRDHHCGVVVMHMQGNPKTMQHSPSYHSVINEVTEYFIERFDSLSLAGIDPLCLCFDPGIGFGKSLEHNKQLIRQLPALRIHDRPLLLGASRKSIIGSILEQPDPLQRDWGTVALTVAARKLGAEIHRVHQVKKNAEALRMIEAILNS